MSKPDPSPAGPPPRPSPRDMLRTFYIHLTLLAALFLFMLLAGPWLLAARLTFE